MNLSDPVADMLTRMRNGCLVKKVKVSMPYSKLKENIANAMQRAGFIIKYAIIDEDNPVKKQIIIYLRYTNNKESVISNIQRVSKPGCRVYGKPGKGFKPNRPQHSVSIWSTSKGIFTDQELEGKFGGEELCVLW